MDAEYKNPGQENFEQWLDAALRARTDAEPRMGLEGRVLARLATEQPRATFSWMPLLATATAVVAVSVALIVTYSSRRSGQIAVLAPPSVQSIHKPEAPRTFQAANTIPEAQRSTKTTAHRSAKVGTREAARTADREQDLPKLVTFPAPSPETAQERLLARLATQRNSLDLSDVSTDLVSLKVLSVPQFKIQAMEDTSADDIPQE